MLVKVLIVDHQAKDFVCWEFIIKKLKFFRAWGLGWEFQNFKMTFLFYSIFTFLHFLYFTNLLRHQLYYYNG